MACVTSCESAICELLSNPQSKRASDARSGYELRRTSSPLIAIFNRGWRLDVKRWHLGSAEQLDGADPASRRLSLARYSPWLARRLSSVPLGS